MMEFYGDILAEANDAPGDKEVFQFKLPSELRHSPMGKAMMIGTVDQVARKLEQFRKDFVCTHLIMSTQLPGLDPIKVTASLELFAKEIRQGDALKVKDLEKATVLMLYMLDEFMAKAVQSGYAGFLA